MNVGVPAFFLYGQSNASGKSGDTLDLRLPMALHLEPLPHSDGKIVAAMYGPTVLAAVVPDEPGIPNPANNALANT